MERAEAEKLYEENEKLVYFVLNKYYPGVTQTDDLRQDARIGLWKACLDFCPARGNAFSTIAVKYIRMEIMKSLRKEHAKMRRPEALIWLDLGKDTDDGSAGRAMYEAITGDKDVDWVDTEAIFGCLTERQQKYMRLYAQGYNISEIGKMFGLTKQRIQQELSEARKKIKRKGLL